VNWKILLAALTIVCTQANRALYAEDRIEYEVRGTSNQDAATDRSWSESYATRAEAQIEMERLKREHMKGGLLEFSPLKPTGLYVKEVTVKGSTGTKRPPKESEPPLTSNSPKGGTIKAPEVPFVDPGAYIGAGAKSPVLKGKKYSGKINGDNVTLEFGDSTVDFTGDRAGPAKYSVLVTKIIIQSERTKYLGTIEKDKISGTFERLDGSEKGDWSMSLIPQVVGRWGQRYFKDGGGTFEWDFFPDGTVIYRDKYSSYTATGTWTKSENGAISGRLTCRRSGPETWDIKRIEFKNVDGVETLDITYHVIDEGSPAGTPYGGDFRRLK
jgi:hypothetical protein